MAGGPLRQGSAPTGTVADEGNAFAEQLYISPGEMKNQYDLTVTEGQIRAAMALVNTTCCRTSLWPERYTERVSVPSDRQQIVLAVTPVIQILEGGGRFVYGRRNTQRLSQGRLDFLVASGSIGTPPSFTPIDVSGIDVFGATGECWIPSGLLLAGWTEVELTYMAGWTQIPNRARFACAEIINSMCARGVSDRQSYSVGRVSQRFASEGFVTKTAMDLLEPFIVRSLG